MKKILHGLLVVFCLFLINSSMAEAAHLFGTLGYGGGQTSTLVELDPDTGATIQTIGSVGYLCNGLDYDATTGVLFGGTSINDSFNGLIEINMTTGAGTPVGAANWGMGGPTPITNITVDSTGQMYGWSEWTDSLVRIDKNTGIVENVYPNYVSTYENGLSFNSADVLYMVNGAGPFYLINTSTGETVYQGSLGLSAHHGDFNPETDLYYGLTWTYGEPRTLLRCDLSAQSYTSVGDVGDLHTLAFVPDVILTKTVGTVEGVCAATREITVMPGTTVYYCFTITNYSEMTYNLHDLVDDQLGTIFTGLSYDLTPGSSISTVDLGLSLSEVINETTTNTATWTAQVIDGETAVATAAATVNVALPIPTMNEWGMIIMSLIIATSAFWMIRRQQVS